MQLVRVARLAKKVAARSATEAIYLNTGWNLTKPNDIRAVLTERCNYRCSYCWHWRRDSYADEMSLSEWQAALVSVRAFVGRYAVQFLGGEPTIVPWFIDLVTFCGNQSIDWGVITNGSTLSTDRVSAMVAAQPLNIDISVDSRRAAVHDAVRGVPRSFQHVSDGVARLVAERERRGRPFAIRLKPTVTRQSMDELGELVDWAESMPSVTVDFSPVRLESASARDAMYPRAGEETDRLERQVDRLVARKRAGAPIETSEAKLRAMVPSFTGVPITHGVDRCRAGLRSISIRPDGEVEHCQEFDRLGNLRRSTMEEIWNAPARRRLAEQTTKCGLIRTTCSSSCTSHRSLRQEVARGVQLVRGAMV